MKNIAFMLVAVFLMTNSNSVLADECYSAVKTYENEGYLYVQVDNNKAYAAVESLIWNNAPYRTKLGIVNCIKKVYGVKKVYLVEMGHPKKLIAVYDGVEFKLY